MPTFTSTFMFEDNDTWRVTRNERLRDALIPESNYRFSYIDIHNELYPLALQTSFEFLTRNHSGRYRDRTLMTIRRWADSVAATTPVQRINESYSDANRPFPIVMIAEAPFSYDEETESKNGGIVGVNVGIDDSDGGWKGIVAVAAGARTKKIGTTLIRAMTSVSSAS